MQIIIDSGSTKSIWYYNSDTESRTFITSGLHPNHLESFSIEDYEKILPLLNNSGKIIFYGSGCLSLIKRLKVEKWLKERFPLFDITVQSDLIGAGLALYGEQSGIVGILGSGSSMAVWHNHTITLPIPSLGWAFIDEGSGTDIARRFFKQWYSGKFPKELNNLLDANPDFPNAHQLIEQIYASKIENRLLADYCKKIANLIHFDPIRKIVIDAFHDYFDYYSQTLKNNKDLPLSFSGSVAFGFNKILSAVAKSRDIELFSVIENPIKQLMVLKFI